MANRYDDMTEAQAREEMARRNHPRDDDPDAREHGGRWMDPFGYGREAMFNGGYGWPFMPPADPYGRHNSRARPDRGWRNDRRMPRGERDFMDKAGDEVASWFGDDAAEARREADHRGRGPKGYVRSDARIEEDVNDRLTEDAFVDAREVSVTVSDREVTLDGTVDSRQAKRHAEDCADSVSGVTHVQNNLRVQTGA
tara:strand:+ start:786 stop:1376 length:591 start_codon:yes stop_codon:yes gene_type:complete